MGFRKKNAKTKERFLGEIEEDELFYLLSRGIKEDKIKDLIYKAVLLGKMELTDEKDLFNKIVNS